MASTATTARCRTAIVWPMSSPAMASAMPYPNSRSPRSSTVGARRVSVPARARSGSRNAVESTSCIPCEPSTSATAEINASVLRVVSRRSTESRVRSGTMPEKMRVCLTWPAIRARVTFARLRMSMHRPSWPSETQWKSATGPAAAAASIAGLASSRIATIVTSCPRLRAASRARNGNWPLPAIKPMRMGRPDVPDYSSTTTGSTRLAGRRRLTPRLEVRMNSTR